jgi:hypothetical protein
MCASNNGFLTFDLNTYLLYCINIVRQEYLTKKSHLSLSSVRAIIYLLCPAAFYICIHISFACLAALYLFPEKPPFTYVYI